MSGVTPLHTAVELAITRVARTLVRYGADISAKASFGQQNRTAIELVYLTQGDLRFLNEIETELKDNVVNMKTEF